MTKNSITVNQSLLKDKLDKKQLDEILSKGQKILKSGLECLDGYDVEEVIVDKSTGNVFFDIFDLSNDDEDAPMIRFKACITEVEFVD